MNGIHAGGGQRKLAGEISYEGGDPDEGMTHSLGYSRGRAGLSSRLSIEPSISLDWVDLPYGKFPSQVVSTRMTFTGTPRMFISALIQYNTSASSLTNNVRLRWGYQPGSERFVVYSDGRDTLSKGYPELINRAFVLKINRLFRFEG